MASDGTDLASHAAFLRDVLAKCQSSRESALRSLNHRVETLEIAMGPASHSATNAWRSQSNIESALQSAQDLLSRLDALRLAEETIKAGPRPAALSEYGDAMARLRATAAFFEMHPGFACANQAKTLARSLEEEAVRKLEESLQALLRKQTRGVGRDDLAAGRVEASGASPGAVGSCSPASAPGRLLEDRSESSPGRCRSVRSVRSVRSAQNVRKAPELVWKFPELVTFEAAESIRAIADLLIDGGHDRLCIRAFRAVRGVQLGEALRLARGEWIRRKFSAEHQMVGGTLTEDESVAEHDSEQQDVRVLAWQEEARLALRVILQAERRLCEQALHGLDTFPERVFAELGAQVLDQLFSFPRETIGSSQSLEKVTLLLDMHRILQSLMPQVETVLEGHACSSLRVKAEGMVQELSSAAKEAFNSFEDTVESDGGVEVPSDCGTHALTAEVLLNLKRLCKYQGALKELFRDDVLPSAALCILTALQRNLEKKSEQYKTRSSLDPWPGQVDDLWAAQRELFFMNNIHCVVQDVKNSELRALLGEEWLGRHRRMRDQHSMAYKRIAWDPVIKLLSVEGVSESGSENSLSRSAAKDRVKSFVSAFEALHQTQCRWRIPSDELRSRMVLMLREALLPAYDHFVQRCKPSRGHLGFGATQHPSKHLKYTEDELVALMDALFLGQESELAVEAPQPLHKDSGRGAVGLRGLMGIPPWMGAKT